MPGKRSFSLINPGHNRQARKTALVVAVTLGALAAWNLYKGHAMPALILGLASAALAGAGLFVPQLAMPFHLAWMRLAEVLGFVNTRILLALMYWLVITPWGWILKLCRHDALLRRSPPEDTYWVQRHSPRQKRDRFEQTF
jgi:hypothetical protein